VRKVRNKNVFWVPIFAFLFFGTLVANVAAPISTVISLDPSGFIDVMPGDGFSVDVTISGAVNLGGWEIQLSYDTSVLTATSLTVVTDWFGPVFIWKNDVDDSTGNVHAIATLWPMPRYGKDGSGVIATIDFTVDSIGDSLLSFHGTLLGDPEANPIVHTAVDGYFANVPVPQLWIEGKGAMGGGVYPLWHVNSPGTPQTLYSRVVNTGDVGCYVKAMFKVYAPGIGTWMLESTAEWLDPKPIEESEIVSASFTETDAEGLYFVTATLLFSLDGTIWVPYAALESAVGGDGTARDIATKFKTLEQY